VVVCISQQTAQDVMSFLGTPEEKIKVIYQGTHPQFTWQVLPASKTAVQSKWKLPAAYILSVGTVEPRKNMMAAVQALAMLPKERRLPLVIVGRETAYKDTVAEHARSLGILSEIIFLHNVSFSDLPALYQGSSLFLYPSLFEGFGIPIVEALQSGVPVISSTGSCFSEAGGPHSLYADPANPAELASQMLHVLSDPALRNTMIEKGKRYAERFTPRQIASDLMEVYRG
jgi:glycosyltransferase involved in cell wall biosynthesis